MLCKPHFQLQIGLAHFLPKCLRCKVQTKKHLQCKSPRQDAKKSEVSDNRHESFVELTPVLMLVFSVYGVIEKINCSITIEFRLLVVSIPYSSNSLCGMKYTSLKLKKFPILVL